MGVKFGDIDSSQIIENEYRIAILEGIVDWLIEHGNFEQGITKDVFLTIQQGVVQRMKKKYPNSGIELKKK